MSEEIGTRETNDVLWDVGALPRFVYVTGFGWMGDPSMDIGIIGDRIDGYAFTVRKINDQWEKRWCCAVSDAAGAAVGSTCAERPDDATRQGMEIAFHESIRREQADTTERGK